jgi:hypothetical protein
VFKKVCTGLDVAYFLTFRNPSSFNKVGNLVVAIIGQTLDLKMRKSLCSGLIGQCSYQLFLIFGDMLIGWIENLPTLFLTDGVKGTENKVLKLGIYQLYY